MIERSATLFAVRRHALGELVHDGLALGCWCCGLHWRRNGLLRLELLCHGPELFPEGHKEPGLGFVLINDSLCDPGRLGLGPEDRHRTSRSVVPSLSGGFAQCSHLTELSFLDSSPLLPVGLIDVGGALGAPSWFEVTCL